MPSGSAPEPPADEQMRAATKKLRDLPFIAEQTRPADEAPADEAEEVTPA